MLRLTTALVCVVLQASAAENELTLCSHQQIAHCLRVGSEQSPLSGDQTEHKYTSTCSHVHCLNIDGVTQVHSHRLEQYGNKHVCRHGMHRTNHCGCECYTELMGEGFFNHEELDKILSAEAKQILMRTGGYNFDHKPESTVRFQMEFAKFTVANFFEKETSIKVTIANSLGVDLSKVSVTPPTVAPTPSWYQILPNAGEVHSATQDERSDEVIDDSSRRRLQGARGCITTPWSEWSTCSQTCGDGAQIRTRSVSNGCIDTPHSENQDCNTQACPAATTGSPTKAPTAQVTEAHPCDDGSHGCDKGPGGQCLRSVKQTPDGAVEHWSCACKADYWCKSGCTAPHTAHECVLTTHAPSKSPTPTPTTAAVTLAPTLAPTKTPTATPAGIIVNVVVKTIKPAQIAAKIEGQEFEYSLASAIGAQITDLTIAKPEIEIAPTRQPTAVPSASPTAIDHEHGHGHGDQWKVNLLPSVAPTAMPTPAPSANPSSLPTPTPTSSPTRGPTAPTSAPTQVPTNAPSKAPTAMPTQLPTESPTEAPTKVPTAAPTMPPTNHACVDGSHNCDKEAGGICYKAEDGTNGWTCGCMAGYACSRGCLTPHAFHTCVLTATPTSYPSPKPTLHPTNYPTKLPTLSPTFHSCDDGSHGCDKNAGGVCYKLPAATAALLGTDHACGCAQQFWCSAGCDAPHEGHTCTEVTPTPTAAPTEEPTPVSATNQPSTQPTHTPTNSPTPHPCEDGSHGCHSDAGGICYKGEGDAWTCGCSELYFCTAGCTAPHTGHECAVITEAPTQQPTKTPTTQPSEHPTKLPTKRPTLAPTVHPCDEGSHGCDKGEGGICYHGEGHSWTCGCKNTHYCSAGCTDPHLGHQCTLTTRAPTSTPTEYPTKLPTNWPTKSPTTGAPTPAPTTQLTAQTTNPQHNPAEKPVYHIADFVNVDAAHNAASTPPPTASPTLAPTPTGYVMVPVTETATVIVSELDFPINQEAFEGTTGAIVKMAMEEGFAAAIGMPTSQVAISSIAANRRLLESSVSTKIVFQITSFSSDLVQVAKLEAHIEESSAEGSLVANIQKKAMENGVLSPALAAMPRQMIVSSLRTTTVSQTKMVAQEQVVCPTDMFTCPGGDLVGRVDQDCHFATCPEYSGQTTTKQPSADVLSAILQNPQVPANPTKSAPSSKSSPVTDGSTYSKPTAAQSLLNPAKLTQPKDTALMPSKSTPIKPTSVIPAKTPVTGAAKTPVTGAAKTSVPTKSNPVSSTLSGKQSSWLDAVNAYLKPTKTKPVTGTSAATTPAKSTPVKSAPVKSAPVKSAPTETVPVKTPVTKSKPTL